MEQARGVPSLVAHATTNRNPTTQQPLFKNPRTKFVNTRSKENGVKMPMGSVAASSAIQPVVVCLKL